MGWKPQLFKIFSCKHFTELESKRLDEKSLQGFDRFAHLYHKMICLCCRRFARQLQLIEKAARDVANSENEPIDLDHKSLSKESREKILSALEKEAQSHSDR